MGAGLSEPRVIEARFKGAVGGFALDAAFTAPGRGVTALFGPSGCGKTTVLRCLAGLTRLRDGYCRVGGAVWQDGDAVFLPTHRRSLGYVFQDVRLFPHLSVRNNLTFGAPRQGSPVAFDEVVDLLALAPFLGRAPRHLSGGERQRVALGRALLSQPALLLMDEPLSALDAAAKAEILPFLERLHDRLSLPSIYVTHDMTEVERLADHLVLMDAGRVIASGPLAELQSDPSLSLAAARGAAVSLDGQIDHVDIADGLMSVGVRGGAFLVATVGAVGERRRLRILAGDVSLARETPRPSSILNVLPARILSARALDPGETLVLLGLGADGAGEHILSRITRRSFERLSLAVDMPVFAQIKGVALSRSPAPQ